MKVKADTKLIIQSLTNHSENWSFRPLFIDLLDNENIYCTNVSILLCSPIFEISRIEQVNRLGNSYHLKASNIYKECKYPAIYEINLFKLKSLIAELPLTEFEEIECQEWSGDGEIDCDCCGNSDDCEECNGGGYKRNDTKILDTSQRIGLDEINGALRLSILTVIIDICNHMDLESTYLNIHTFHKEKNILYFSITKGKEVLINGLAMYIHTYYNNKEEIDLYNKLLYPFKV